MEDIRTILDQIKHGIKIIEARLKDPDFDPLGLRGLADQGMERYDEDYRTDAAAIWRQIRELLAKCDSIKKEVRAIECAIFSPTFGLKVIKEEVSAIEAKLDSPTFGLSEIKAEVSEILGGIFSSTFGLSEIKSEIIAIEAKLDSPTFGLSEIKAEISAIEAKLDSPTFGLSEIKAEVAQIETKLDIILPDIKFEIINIENKLDSPTFGLSEIKAEVSEILGAIFSSTFGLSEIKSEISAIEAKLDSPTFGLSEIKAEVSELLAGRGLAMNLTTGPFLKNNAEQDLHLKALNYTNTTQTVTFVVHDLTPCITTLVVAPLPGITPCCAAFTDVSIGTGVRNMEVRAELSTTFGLFVYAVTRAGVDKIERYIAADWLPLTTFCA